MKGGEEMKEVVCVCVTGASGYIASWLVKLLLLRGYHVRGTVRDLDDPTKTEHLMGLEGAKERLHLFKADLTEEGSFDNAISGCQGVFHVASPVKLSVTDPQVEVLDPAVKGTLNVLRSCKRNPSVRRVVLTSSMATVLFNGVPRSPEVVVDETWFSKLEYCDEYPFMKWYIISKVMAEEAACKFCKQNNIDLISMNPAMVIGPMLQPTLNESVASVFNLINGAETYQNSSFGWVNVKDVANAHILAFEVPSANGRYCLVERVAHYFDLVKLLKELYPNAALPEKCVDDQPFEPVYQVSKEKIKSLAINYIELKDSVKETVECLKDKDDPAKTQHLLVLDGAKERLHLFEANLLEDASFDSAFHGCDAVFHVASPIAFDSPNPQADIIDPAVKGTLNVLASCSKATVKRVILTSSTAAVQHNGRPLTDQTVIDETWFSSPEVCMGLKGKWYLLSKTLAEDAAWKFAKENDIDIVMINPAMVIGPMLQPTLNFSTGLILSLINAGLEKYPNASFGWVHVKDVAEAHIRAYELPSANGRYVMSERVLHISEVIKIIQELYPNKFKPPTECGDDRPFEPTFKISMDKVRTLGLDNYIPFTVSLMETIECFKEKKFLV